MKKHGPPALVRDAVTAPSGVALTVRSGAARAAAARRPAPPVQLVPRPPRSVPRPPLVLRPSDPWQDWNGWAALANHAQVGVDAQGYLYADGRADNPVHAHQVQQAYAVLHTRFRSREDVSVLMTVNLHYRRGDRRAFLAPDVMVTFGDHDPVVTSHRVWEHGVPSLVLEVLSASTWENDLGPKKRVYERMGVAEYVLYDPRGRWLPEQLLMFRRVGGAYVERQLSGPKAVVADDGTVREVARVAHSEIVGLDFLVLDGELRLRDPATRQLLRAYHEAEAKVRTEEARADRERQRADREAEARRNAEARVAELEKMLRERTPGGGATSPPDHEQDHPASAEARPGTTRKR